MRTESMGQGRSDERQQGCHEQVRRNALQCPHCQQLWLVLNVRSQEPYRCKSCGRSFVVQQ
jgi:transposase-like protein